MNTITLSPKFQVAIPKSIREELHLTSGMKLAIVSHEGRIELIPLGPIDKLKGLFPTLSLELEREPDRL